MTLSNQGNQNENYTIVQPENQSGTYFAGTVNLFTLHVYLHPSPLYLNSKTIVASTKEGN
jgi:hypothetical protein